VDLLVTVEVAPILSDFMKLRISLEDLLGVKGDLVTETGLRDCVQPYVERRNPVA
jgi:predicted nucleotidyltransferase